LSGNFFTWGKDNLTWGVAGGDGIGDGIANNIGVATNFGGALNGQAVNATDSRSNFSLNRPLYDAAVLATTIVSWSGRIGYQHWWTPELRSTVDFSVNHNDIPALVQASGRAANNKELALAHVNLIWSPVAFVDLGIEGGWGQVGAGMEDAAGRRANALPCSDAAGKVEPRRSRRIKCLQRRLITAFLADPHLTNGREPFNTPR